MSHRPRIENLSQADWQRLDTRLAELLELDPDERVERLSKLAQREPDDAALLTRLLKEGSDERRLQPHLTSALGFLAERQSPQPGARIGAWRLIRSIGQGGMAEVYLAERADGAFERKVALKLLHPGLVSRDADRFVRQERQILADLDDPRVAGLVDGGLTDSGRPWLAMEYVRGQPIDRAVQQSRLALSDRIRLFIEVVEAVAVAHRQLVVHGDIKPANVLVTEAGQVKLLDFGIGRLLDEQSADGRGWKALTPSWASPEQLRGQPPSTASDVYQLGLLLRALVDDARPAGRRRERELDAVLARALVPDPKRRYPGADRMAADLTNFLAHRPVSGLRGGLAYRGQCLLRRRWPTLTLTALVLTTGITLLAIQLQQSYQLAERNAANEAVLVFLEEMLNRSNPQQPTAPLAARVDVLSDAAAGLEQRLGDQPQARARVLNTLGRIHQSRNENVLAGRRHAQALTLARKHAIFDELDGALEGLAEAGIWGGNYARSEDSLRELIELRKRSDSSQPALDRARLQLADLLHSRGKYAAALEQARAAHAGGIDPGWSGRVLGMILRDQGRFEEAAQALEASRTIESSRTPPSAPRLAELSDHQALLLLHRGDLEAAQQALAESSRLRRSYLGEDWDGLVWTRHWDALHALATGHLERAASLLDTQRADYARFLGESSHVLAFARSDRAYAALGLGDIATARALFEQAAHRLERMQDGDHPRLSEVLLGLALVELAEGRTDPARAFAERALAIRRRLPDDAIGASTWRANACRILERTGGRCTDAANDDARRGLDADRIEAARSGPCEQPGHHEAAARLCRTDPPFG